MPTDTRPTKCPTCGGAVRCVEGCQCGEVHLLPAMPAEVRRLIDTLHSPTKGWPHLQEALDAVLRLYGEEK